MNEWHQKKGALGEGGLKEPWKAPCECVPIPVWAEQQQ